MAQTNPLGWRRILGPFAPRPRLSIGVAVGVVTGLAFVWLAPEMKVSTRLILGWDTLSMTFLSLMLANMVGRSPADIRQQAEADDEGRGLILGLVLTAAAASVWAISLELSLAKEAHGAMKAAHIVLGFLTVIASWMMVQMIFALHYAHAYYGVDESDGARDAGGIEFPGHEPPDYWDFLYFSVIIGTASQTADCNILSKGLRRLNTFHCLIAFAFNTIIVALTINLTAGLF